MQPFENARLDTLTCPPFADPFGPVPGAADCRGHPSSLHDTLSPATLNVQKWNNGAELLSMHAMTPRIAVASPTKGAPSVKNLFEPGRATEVKERMARLSPTSGRLWGTMTAAQALAHCSASMEMALGDRTPDRMRLGRIAGWVVKPLLLRNDEPMRRGSSTMKELIVQDERELEGERERLSKLVDRFAAGGPRGCTTHPHSFLGRLSPDEWAILTYKHLDHHLRQFGV